MLYDKSIDYQDVAQYNGRNIYIYLLENGKKIVSFFEYKKGELYGGRELKKIEKLVEVFKPSN